MYKLFIFIMIFIFSLTPQKAFAANEIPEEVYIVAEDSLVSISDTLLSNPEKWGIPSSQSQLSLGDGFKINYVDADKLSMSPSKNPEKLVDTSIIEQWQFIIYADNEPILFLTIFEDGDQYELAGYGGDASRYAQALEMAYSQNHNLDKDLSLYCFGNEFYFISGKTVYPSYDVVDNSKAITKTLQTITTDQWISGLQTIVEEYKSDSTETRRGSAQIVITQTTTPSTNYLPYIGAIILLSIIGFIITKKR